MSDRSIPQFDNTQSPMATHRPIAQMETVEDSVVLQSTNVVTPRHEITPPQVLQLHQQPAGPAEQSAVAPAVAAMQQDEVASVIMTTTSGNDGSSQNKDEENEDLNNTRRPSDAVGGTGPPRPKDKKDKVDKKEKKDKKSKKDTSSHRSIEPMSHPIAASDDLPFYHSPLRGAPSGQRPGPAVVVSVHGMSPTEPDIRVCHPFVRMFIVDCATGQPYADAPDGLGGYQCLQAITYPFDLRSRQCRAPLWNDDVPVPISEDAYAPDADPMLLVEVLDFGTTTVQGHYDGTRPGGYYRIAWGFLHLKVLLGHDLQLPMSNLHMQLFYFCDEYFGPIVSNLLSFVPSWFAHPAMHAGQNIFRMPPQPTRAPPPALFNVYANQNNRKISYPGGMTISLKFLSAAINVPPFAHTASNASYFEMELLQQLRISGAEAGRSVEANSRSLAMGRAKEITENPYINLEYRRNKGERVVPPSTILHEVRVHGTVTSMAFSGNGRLLALSVTTTLQTVIDIREVFSNQCSTIGLFRGHADLVHHVEFDKETTLLLSCSADKTVKVWSVAALPCIVTSSIDEHQICVCTLPHGFPVYCAVFHQNHIVSAGYDTRIHIWKVDVSTKTARLVTVVPNPSTTFYLNLVSADDTRVWSVDSNGTVTVWRAVADEVTGELNQVSIRRKIECKGAASITVAGMYALLPCPRDGACYIVEVSSFKVLHRIHGVSKDTTGFCLLPDGKTFVAGLKTGRMMAWETTSGDLCSSRDGTTKAQVSFPIAKVSWSQQHQMCAVASYSAAFASIAKNNAGGLVQESSSSRVQPANSCVVAILGEPRDDNKVVMENDPRAMDYIRSLFGGEISLPTIRSAGAAGGESASVRQRNVVLQPVPSGSINSGRFNLEDSVRGPSRGAATGSGGAPATRPADKISRMDQIVNFWKVMVGNHKRTPPGTQPPSGATAPPTAVPVEARI